MGKVIIISSSMRDGNSNMLSEEFKKGALEANNQVEKIDLKDLNLKYCLGCGVCQETGKCVIKDDVSMVLNKIVDSDVIVFATPVYFGSICGQLKVLLDRMYPLYKKIKNKKIYVIATCYQNSKKHIDDSLQILEIFLKDIGDLKIDKVIYGENCDEPKDASIIQRNNAYNEGKKIK